MATPRSGSSGSSGTTWPSWMMPGMDGTTLYSEIKKVRPGIVALMVTAYPAHPRAVDAISAGVQRLVAKPVDCCELTALIGEVVRRPLLLVVDGDANLCATLGDVLCERGYRVCVAISVANAMDYLADDEFCVILLDLVLPDGNGSQVFQTARASNPAACVVVISGCQAEIEPQIRQLSAEGASAVFRKPVDVPRLMAELTRLREVGWQSPA